jgi:hypothetical protein
MAELPFVLASVQVVVVVTAAVDTAAAVVRMVAVTVRVAVTVLAMASIPSFFFSFPTKKLERLPRSSVWLVEFKKVSSPLCFRRLIVSYS